MPTNRELKERASALAAKLGVELGDTERMNRGALEQLVSGLEAEDARSSDEQRADDAAISPAPARRFVVAPGAVVTGPRGSLGPGSSIRTGDLDPATLEALRACGAVIPG